MDLATPHTWIGTIIVGTWATICGWAVALRFTRYDETPTFWKAVSVAQILLVVQLLYGIVLLFAGRRPGDASLFETVFHALYGFGFPLVVLFFAHKWSREGRYDPHSAFAVAAFVIFALTVRGWLLGAGMG